MKLVKHIVIALTACLLTVGSCIAQDSTQRPFKPQKRYTPLPLIPSFPGGKDSLALFIKTHTRYPAAARKHHITGVVQVVFVVTKEGDLKNPYIYKSLSASCDKEALRVVKLMPRWRPGMMGRDPMEMDFHVDIPFGTEAPKQNNP